MNELKECPFCGGVYRDRGSHSKTCYIMLVRDNFEAFATDNDVLQHDETDMEEAWNTRYERTCKWKAVCDEQFWNTECNMVCECYDASLPPNYCPSCGGHVKVVIDERA